MVGAGTGRGAGGANRGAAGTDVIATDGVVAGDRDPPPLLIAALPLLPVNHGLELPREWRSPVGWLRGSCA